MQMKKSFFILILLIITVSFISCFPTYIMDVGFANRTATEVKSVLSPGNIDFFLFPDEEDRNDHKVTNAPECDIKAGAACNDEDQLRFDIVLYNMIALKVDTFFTIKAQYGNMIEYYDFYPSRKKLFIYQYDFYENLISSEEVDMDQKSDFAQVNSWDNVENIAVTFLIDKEKHMGDSNIGNSVYLTVSMFSNYITSSNQAKIADFTAPVNVYFKR